MPKAWKHTIAIFDNIFYALVQDSRITLRVLSVLKLLLIHMFLNFNSTFWMWARCLDYIKKWSQRRIPVKLEKLKREKLTSFTFAKEGDYHW